MFKLKGSHTSVKTTVFSFIPYLSAWLNALAIWSLNRLELSACLYTLTVMSVSRRLTQLCHYGVANSS